jgi:hypothetical protein
MDCGQENLKSKICYLETQIAEAEGELKDVCSKLKYDILFVDFMHE